MPVTLRKRLTCHYCGKRLNTTKREGSKINCESCSADNYFDADNNILDVPPTVAAQPTRPSRAAEIESESDIFCKTCLTNQSFYVHALADYLPDEDDPRYDELERALPEFKKDLDLRYPRCCAQCEARVQARIQQANYAAKADHLRRLMHRRQGRRWTPGLQLRSLFISAAGLGHVVSLVLQLTWHAFSSQANTDAAPQPASLRQCLAHWPVPARCSERAASWVPSALMVGLLCIWWNPKWQHRLMGREGRLAGLRTYYIAQLLLMALRSTAWALVKELPPLQRYATVVHTLCLGLFTMLSVYAWFGVIYVDTTPLVDWHQAQVPLVSPDQFRPPVHPGHLPPPSQTKSQFSIDSLAGPSGRAYEPWRPPTPPATEDDSMDWAPTDRTFNPQPRMPRPKFDQPSPFYGTLPAAPARGSLNPARPAPPPQKQALGLPPGFFGLSKSRDQPESSTATKPSEYAFAPARFFAHEREADTGLEHIFDKMFSVRDSWDAQGPPPDPPSTSRRASTNPFKPSRTYSTRPASSLASSASQPPLKLVVCCASIVALAVVASSLCSLEFVYGETTAAPSTILPYTAVVPALHILVELLYPGKPIWPGLAVPLAEVVLALLARYFMPADGSASVPMWNKVVIGIICFFLLQEIYRFCQLQAAPTSQAAAGHMSQSMQQAGQEQAQSPQTHGTTGTSHPPPQSVPSQSSQQLASPAFPQTQAPLHESILPAQTSLQSQAFPFTDYQGSVRKRDSDESISSISSIQTTSTASGWKTPKNESRTFDWRTSHTTGRGIPRQPGANIARGLGGLSLGNDFGIGSGTSIAGPRRNAGNGIGRYS